MKIKAANLKEGMKLRSGMTIKSIGEVPFGRIEVELIGPSNYTRTQFNKSKIVEVV